MLNSCTLCKFVCHYVYVSLAICETVKTLKEPLHLRNSSICTVNAGRFSSVNVIFINFKHFVSNATWSFQKLIIHFIAQINALNSECEGDKHFRIFLAPIKPSKSPCLLYNFRSTNKSESFHEPSIFHQRGKTKHGCAIIKDEVTSEVELKIPSICVSHKSVPMLIPLILVILIVITKYFVKIVLLMRNIKIIVV